VNKMTLLLLLSGCLAIALPAKAAGDAAAGKDKSEKCADCHGDDGMGDEDTPPLAGIPPSYFVKAMEEYKNGDRKHKKMEKAAKKLNDQDFEDLAAYYKSLHR
jgi:cytochrome c553